MTDFQEIFNAADAAGKIAGSNCKPTVVVFGQAKSLFSSEIDYSKPVDIVDEGVCGFAWISFKGNTPWGRWAKKTGKARNGYPSGLQIWVSDYNQSMQRKEAYAEAFAKVLRDHGISAYAGSRLD